MRRCKVVDTHQQKRGEAHLSAPRENDAITEQVARKSAPQEISSTINIASVCSPATLHASTALLLRAKIKRSKHSKVPQSQDSSHLSASTMLHSRFTGVSDKLPCVWIRCFARSATTLSQCSLNACRNFNSIPILDWVR